MDTFYRDLKRGKAIEKAVLNIVRKTYPDAKIIDGYCKEWDIFIPSKNFGVEVKSDLMSKYTGNLVIETSFNGRPSALNTTKAKTWVFYTGDKFLFTTPEKVRKVISDNNLHEVTFTGKGDTKSKTAYLVKKFLIEQIAEIVPYLGGKR